MRFSEGIQVASNFHLTVRERGKIVPGKCVENHNIWVNLGREFLPRVVSPSAGFGGRVMDTVVGYMSFGVGGNKQITDVDTLYPAIATDYPGLLTYDKGTPGIRYLERPIRVTGAAGTSGVGNWAVPVAAPPTFISSGGVSSIVEYTVVLDETAMSLSGAYPSVPLSEAGMMLYNQNVIGVPPSVFYSYSSPPSYSNPARPTLVAYNNFGTITKTTDVTLEVRWQLQF